MKLTDLLIIYLAIGAPFGVYQITAARHLLTVQAVLWIFLRICFWPVFGLLALIEWFSKGQTFAKSNLDRRIDDIRAEIESLVFDDDSICSIFNFREILHRYAGLSEAANAGVAPDGTNEIFELGTSGNKEIASACLARKNQRKLSFQQSLARDEFVDMISEFAAAGLGRESILGLTVELATAVNDHQAVSTLTALMSETQFPAQVMESETSIIESRSASSVV